MDFDFKIINGRKVQVIKSITAGGGETAAQSQGNVADDEIDLGNPVKIGGKASDGNLPNVSIGDRVDALFTEARKLVIAGYDYDSESITETTINPAWSRGTDSEEVAASADIGVADGVWKSQGIIPVKGFHNITLNVGYTANDSITPKIRVMVMRTIDDTKRFPKEVLASYQKDLPEGLSEELITYSFGVEGINYIDIQTQAADVDDGGGTIGTINIDIVKDY